MVSDRKNSYIKYVLLILNIIVVNYLAIIIYITTKRVCSYYMARDFISRISAIPSNPQKILISTIFLVLCLIISFVIREFIWVGKNICIYISLSFDFIISLILMVILNYNCNSILFWVFANIIFYVQDKVKMIFMFLAITLYVGTDYEFLNIRYHLYSIRDYMAYYDSHTQQYLLGIYNILVSLNVIIFILLCVYVIQAQRGIIEQVNSLYKQLTQKNMELENANVELKQFADMKEKMGETKERNRLAREIHDTLGHTLTGISAGIDACLTMIDTNTKETKKRLGIVSDVTRDGIEEVRRSVSELNPDALDRLSLESSIRNMIDKIISVTQAQIVFTCEVENLKFDEDEENTIYRIVQESITNAVRHGKASKIWGTIHRENDELHLKIQDTGSGCVDMKKGFGTKHMIERAKLLNGTVSFNGKNGFLVQAVIPIRWGEEYD